MFLLPNHQILEPYGDQQICILAIWIFYSDIHGIQFGGVYCNIFNKLWKTFNYQGLLIYKPAVDERRRWPNLPTTTLNTLNTWKASNCMFLLFSRNMFIMSLRLSGLEMYRVIVVKLCLSNKSSPNNWNKRKKMGLWMAKQVKHMKVSQILRKKIK